MMLTILLSILKIIGIILLSVFLLILVLLCLILFVPVRYQVKGYRKEGDEVPVKVLVKITWLLHILNVAFKYPKEAYIKVRVFCFTVFSTEKKKEKEEKAEEKKENKEEGANTADIPPEQTKETISNEENNDIHEDECERIDTEPAFDTADEEPEPQISNFIRGFFNILKNIKYTIHQIYDKIIHIIKNISYYIKIIKSDSFQRAWKVCGKETLLLIRSVFPKKISGNFIIGTGDPASTAQILSIQGILYPLIGDHISVTPDFERSIVEGDFDIKGRITVVRILITAIKVYFNKDLRKIIRLLKKEAV